MCVVQNVKERGREISIWHQQGTIMFNPKHHQKNWADSKKWLQLYQEYASFQIQSFCSSVTHSKQVPFLTTLKHCPHLHFTDPGRYS